MNNDILIDFALIITILFIAPYALYWLWEHVIKPLARGDWK